MECLGACDRAPVMMVNNDHWHERLQPEQVGGLVDRMKTDGVKALSDCYLCEQRIGEGTTTTTPAKATALPGLRAGADEVRLHARRRRARSLPQESERLRRPEEGVDDDAGRGDRRRQEVGSARPRRRRFPDRPQVAVRRQEIAEAEIHRLQRRRERAGHLQGSPVDGAQPPPAGGGVPDRLLRHRLEGRLHLHSRRVLPPLPDDAEGDRRCAQGGVHRQEHSGLGL